MKCFFCFAARCQPKVTKIQKVAGISNFHRTKLLKKVHKKCSPLIHGKSLFLNRIINGIQIGLKNKFHCHHQSIQQVHQDQPIDQLKQTNLILVHLAD